MAKDQKKKLYQVDRERGGEPYMASIEVYRETALTYYLASSHRAWNYRSTWAKSSAYLTPEEAIAAYQERIVTQLKLAEQDLARAQRGKVVLATWAADSSKIEWESK